MVHSAQPNFNTADDAPGSTHNDTLAQANVMIAGADRVAVDAVGLVMLKSLGANDAIIIRRIFAEEQIARAVELNLGVTGPNQIEIVTPVDAESRACAETLRGIPAQG